MNHENIISFIDIIELNTNAFCTVLEYCDGTDLEQYLIKYTTIPENEAYCILIQVFSKLKSDFKSITLFEY